MPFIIENVKPGATVTTDGWQGYNLVTKVGFNHDVKHKKNDEVMLPHVHRVFSLLKNWLLGTYQGGVQKKYLDFYLDEYVFRFNRKSSIRSKLFKQLVEQTVVTPPITRKSLIIKNSDI
jgi:transposase-like protein